jgi:hypothetical protein
LPHNSAGLSGPGRPRHRHGAASVRGGDPVDQAKLNRDVSLERLGEYLLTVYDIVVLAFQTDLTRVVTFSSGNEGTGPASPLRQPLPSPGRTSDGQAG